MRTTIDLPDDLYRVLKARAGLRGVTLRQLIQRLIEEGLRSSPSGAAPRNRPGSPPIIIPRRGVPIAALSPAELARTEEEDDEAKYARLT